VGPIYQRKKERASIGLLLATGPRKRKERRLFTWDREGESWAYGKKRTGRHWATQAEMGRKEKNSFYFEFLDFQSKFEMDLNSFEF